MSDESGTGKLDPSRWGGILLDAARFGLLGGSVQIAFREAYANGWTDVERYVLPYAFWFVATILTSIVMRMVARKK